MIDYKAKVEAVSVAYRKLMEEISYDKAEVMSKECGYAFDHCDNDGENPVNWADAAAFFLEGYTKAMEDLKREVMQ